MPVSILIVDDEPDVAVLFRQQFRRETREGTYVLHFVLSASEALERLADEIEPQLIVIRDADFWSALLAMPCSAFASKIIVLGAVLPGCAVTAAPTDGLTFGAPADRLSLPPNRSCSI